MNSYTTHTYEIVNIFNFFFKEWGCIKFIHPPDGSQSIISLKKITVLKVEHLKVPSNAGSMPAF